jgi:hypothetical protein
MNECIYEEIKSKKKGKKNFDEKPACLFDIVCISIGNELIFSRFVNTAKKRIFQSREIC